jgi:hypothetical protein
MAKKVPRFRSGGRIPAKRLASCAEKGILEGAIIKMPETSFIRRLQTRWGVHSAWQVLVILVVFALTGFSAMYIKRPIFALLGIDGDDPWWLRTLVWMVTVLPAYQVLLLLYGFLLGQFSFFWAFEKRMFDRIRKLFSR